MPFTSLFTVATLAAAAVAAPLEQRAQPAVLPLTHINTATSASNIVANGKSKISQINSDSSVSKGNTLASSGSITNEDVSYVAPVSIGGKTYELIVDTGCKTPQPLTLWRRY
jgi:hypothetical protein